MLVLLSKPDCHLCHRMRDVVESVLADFGTTLLTRDVREDAELYRRYGNDIPVLLLEGAEVARHRISAGELRERLIALGLPALRRPDAPG